MGKRVYIFCLTFVPAIIFSLALLLFYPCFLKPRCASQIMLEAQKNSEKIAKHFILEHNISISDFHLNDTKEFETYIEGDIENFQLWKVRLFNEGGIIIYSSKKTEIGNVNYKPYFTNIIAKGNTYSKIVNKLPDGQLF